MGTLIRRIIPILLLLAILAYGYQLWNLSRQVASLWSFVLSAPGPEAGQEVAALRAQLEVMRQYDQRLLQTVYWALAVIVVIAAALIGFGWLANFRVYERDKTIMQQDLKNSLEKAVAETRNTLNKSITETKDSLDKIIAEMRDALAAEVRKGAKEAADTTTRSLSGKIERLTGEVREIQYNRFMSEARGWEKTISSNAFGSYIEAAEAALDPWCMVPLGLEKALDGIVRLLEAKVQISSYHLTQLKPVLEKLPQDHADVVKKVRVLAGI